MFCVLRHIKRMDCCSKDLIKNLTKIKKRENLRKLKKKNYTNHLYITFVLRSAGNNFLNCYMLILNLVDT